MTATMRPETIQGIREELGATDKDHAHIVRVGPGQNAAAVVLRARVNQTIITALCGYTWIPQKDPSSLPLCPKCKDIYDLHRTLNDNALDETPVV